MIRFLVKESLASQGVQATAEVEHPRQLGAEIKHENPSGVVVLCLSGPPEVWKNTIAETRRSLPGGRVVAVTFGAPVNTPGSPMIDHRLGADSLVEAPAPPEVLRDAILRAKVARSPVAP